MTNGLTALFTIVHGPATVGAISRMAFLMSHVSTRPLEVCSTGNSVTCMRNDQVAVSPDASVAAQVTNVVPGGKIVPQFGRV